MDQNTLIANLTAALTQVIADEATLQSAITAVQGVVTTPTVDANDAVVADVVAVLVTAGLVTAVTPAEPTPPEAEVAAAPEAPVDTTAPATDESPAPESAPELPATDGSDASTDDAPSA